MRLYRLKYGMFAMGIVVLFLFGLSACLMPLRAVITADVTQGSAPLRVVFDPSKSTGNITGFLLDFGDGTTHLGEDISLPISHVYENPGSYTATLTVWNANGRESADSLDITVEYPELSANLQADVTRGFVPLRVTFDPSQSKGAITSFSLDFGDGNVYTHGIAANPSSTEGLYCAERPHGVLGDPITHVYEEPGTYQAVLTVHDRWGRSARDSVEITVEPSNLRAILSASPQTGYAPLEVTFDLSKSLGEIEGFVLDFGDGKSVEGLLHDLADPIRHTYRDPGTYTATLTVRDVHGAEDSHSLVINALYPPLAAVLSAQPTSGAAPLEVTFDISKSEGPILYFILDFGDGDMVNGIDITYAIIHTYSQPGTYTATLTVVDIYGRSDAATVEIRAQ